jgi:hypothetical protein
MSSARCSARTRLYTLCYAIAGTQSTDCFPRAHPFACAGL